jgi:hypothetical protein
MMALNDHIQSQRAYRWFTLHKKIKPEEMHSEIYSRAVPTPYMKSYAAFKHVREVKPRKRMTSYAIHSGGIDYTKCEV